MQVLILIPLLGTLGLFAIAFIPALQEAVTQLGEATILNKMTTQSGVERSLWNSQALAVFFATYGLGAGVGSVRASSFLIALLANVGVIGTALYAMFLLSALRERGLPRNDPYRRAVQDAARAACIALLVSASVAGGSVDLGLVFSLLAGIGSSRLRASRHAAPAAVRLTRRPVLPTATAPAGEGPTPCPA